MKEFPFFQTARARLTLWNMLVLALVILILGGVVRVTVAHNLMASVDSDLASRAKTHQEFWAKVPWASHDIGRSMRRDRQISRQGEKRIQGDPAPSGFTAPNRPNTASRWRAPVIERIFDLKGEPSWPPDDKERPWDSATFCRSIDGQEGYSTVMVDNEQVRVFSAPLRRKWGEMAGVVQVGSSLAAVGHTLGNLNRTLLMLTPVALLITGMGGLFLTGRMLRPVREVTHAAGRIGAEDLSQRLVVRGQDEFSQLAATFNAMLGRLDESFEQQRRFIADASHELRTPLTVIKANTSLTLSQKDLPTDYRKVMESVDRSAGMMNRIVQDLLLLARSDSGELKLTLRPIRLQNILEAAIACIPAQGGATITNGVTEADLCVRGDADHLTRLFMNLLENAVRHTPAEGKITVSAHQEGPVVVVTVTDTGTGISPEHLPHICERFYRADAARSRAQGGTGLGLAICHSIVQAHQGSLDITSAPSIGTSVRVTLHHVPPTEV